ncbi:hypothetical protein EH223_10980 [candidate division KSB1 bacterium]|nr:hypothetical protein [candidate division KSB1 bacterium]RQW03145.1 MAG: hypothetical protein EH223_10980 [candidate division KSB1 bacterium]
MDILTIILLVVILGLLLLLLKKLSDLSAKIDALLTQTESADKIGTQGADKPTQPDKRPPSD